METSYNVDGKPVLEIGEGSDGKDRVTRSWEYDTAGNLKKAAAGGFCYTYVLKNSMEEFHNRILYTGQQYDQTSGQYYLRARFYNPVIGRFVQEDVYRGDGLNLYAYCKNNPVVYYDPSGYGGKSQCKGDVDDGGNESDHMIGEHGVQTSSKTTWKNGKTERIDVENPAPGERPGQIHYHDPDNTKWYYNIKK